MKNNILDALKTDMRLKTEWLVMTYGYHYSEIKQILLEIISDCEKEINNIDNRHCK